LVKRNQALQTTLGEKQSGRHRGGSTGGKEDAQEQQGTGKNFEEEPLINKGVKEGKVSYLEGAPKSTKVKKIPRNQHYAKRKKRACNFGKARAGRKWGGGESQPTGTMDNWEVEKEKKEGKV